MIATSRRLVRSALATILAAGLAACGANSDPTNSSGNTDSPTSAGGGVGPIVVGAADFSESQVLAEVYAQALTAAGVEASTRPPIGSREVYLTALQEGSIAIVPEYTGSLLSFFDKEATEKDPDEVYAALQDAVPDGLTVLARSAAEDKNSIVVTKETAQAWSLTSIADLVAHQSELTIAAPPEFQGRPQGLPGLKSEYNLEPAGFRPLKGKAVVDALLGGQAQAANIFSTDPQIAIHGFVTLQDPKRLFGSDNVVPLARNEVVSDDVRNALDAVSAKLETASLSDLVKQVDVDKKDPDVVAREWLKAAGLG